MLVQACLRAPHVVADEAKLVIVFANLFGPGVLFAPHVVADEAKLANVFPYFFLLLSSFLLLLLFIHFRETPLTENLKEYILFIFFMKKLIFARFFLLFTASVRSRSLDKPVFPGV